MNCSVFSSIVPSINEDHYKYSEVDLDGHLSAVKFTWRALNMSCFPVILEGAIWDDGISAVAHGVHTNTSEPAMPCKRGLKTAELQIWCCKGQSLQACAVTSLTHWGRPWYCGIVQAQITIYFIVRNVQAFIVCCHYLNCGRPEVLPKCPVGWTYSCNCIPHVKFLDGEAIFNEHFICN